MTKRKTKTAPVLSGAEEFAGTDAEADAIEKIAAAKAAAATEAEQDKGDNGGPLMDEAAWRRASHELVAEQIEIDILSDKIAEIRGRISSIKKVAEKCGVDWDVVKLFAKYQKRIRIGEVGEVVTEHRRLGQLMKLMDCPLYTQFSLFPDEPQQGRGANGAKPGMDAELQGQHSYSNNEPLLNNPFTQGTEDYFDWAKGWRNAQDANARGMGPAPAGDANGAEAAAH